MIERRSLFLLALSLVCLPVTGKAGEPPIEEITATSSVFASITHNHDQVAISPDGKFVTLQARTKGKDELLVFDAVTKKVRHRLPPAAGFTVMFTPDSAGWLRWGRWAATGTYPATPLCSGRRTFSIRRAASCSIRSRSRYGINGEISEEKRASSRTRWATRFSSCAKKWGRLFTT